MPVSPPFDINQTSPSASDIISAFPVNEQLNRDVIESWLTFISEPSTGLIKSSALPASITLTSLTTDALTMTSTDAGAAVVAGLVMDRNSASPAISDILFDIQWLGRSSTGVSRQYSRIYTDLQAVTNGAETGRLVFRTRSAGTEVTSLTLQGTAAAFSGTATFGGAITVTGQVTSSQNFGSSTAAAVLGTTGAGTVYLRPNGVASGTGQMTVDNIGNANIAGSLQVTGGVVTSATLMIVAANSNTIYLRPNTSGSASGEATLATSGIFTVTQLNVLQSIQSTSVNLILGSLAGGAIYFRPLGVGNATNQAYLDGAGLMVANNFYALSDERFKRDWEPINDFVDRIAQVRTGSYLLHNSPNRQLGTSAQSLLAAGFEDAVREDEEGYYSVSNAQLALVGVVELAKRVLELEAKLA